MVSSDDMLKSAKKLEKMINLSLPSLTLLQKKIRDNDSFPLLFEGLSRISNYYLLKYFTFNK